MKFRLLAFPWYGVWLTGVLGMGLMMFVGLMHYAPSAIAIDLGEACNDIVETQLAYGMHIAVYGAAAFLLLLLHSMLMIALNAVPRFLRTSFILVTFVISLAILGYIAYLTVVQPLLIQSPCFPYLLTLILAIDGLALAGLAWFLHRRNPVLMDDVIWALKRIRVSKVNADRELDAAKEITSKLGKSFKDLRREQAIKSVSGNVYVDIDIGGAAKQFGVEIKLAKSLRTVNEARRIIGQIDEYQELRYGGNLVVVVVGEKSDVQAARVKRTLSRLDKLFRVSYVHVPIAAR